MSMPTLAKNKKQAIKNKFKENPTTPADRWQWTRVLIKNVGQYVLELEGRIKQLEGQVELLTKTIRRNDNG